MANLYSKTTGNWTTIGTFNTLANGTGTDTVPLNTHDVVIQSGHNVTLNSTACVGKSLTINSGGTLTASTSASSTLTLETDLVIDGTATLDVSSDVTKICTILTNNANSSGSGTINAAGSAAPAPNAGGMIYSRYTAILTWKGYARKRWTTLASGISVGATSATVTDATGWQVGDTIIFATTDAYAATPHTDTITIATVNTGTGAITWSGGTTYAHASGGYVGNFSSNLIMGPSAAGRSGNVAFDVRTATTAAKTINHVAFNYLATCSYFGDVSMAYPMIFYAADKTDTGWASFDSNIILDPRGNGYVVIQLNNLLSGVPRSNTIYYAPNVTATDGTAFQGLVTTQRYTTGCVAGTETDMVVFRSAANAVQLAYGSSMSFVRPKITGCETGIWSFLSLGEIAVVDPDILSCKNAFRSTYGKISVSATSASSAKIGTTVACSNVIQLSNASDGAVTMTDANIQGSGTFIANASVDPANTNIVTLVNGAAGSSSSVTKQEIYHPYGTVKRNNSTNKRSTSSLAIAPTTAGVDTQYTVTIPCANGASIKVVGYCQVASTFYNSGTWTAPTCKITGLGISPVTFTATSSSSGAWEQINDGGGNLYLSATNSSGADGNFTLTFTANKLGSSNTGNVYFDGIPTSSPFVTKARNYGYAFDQTIPNVTTNITISASESTALGYASQFTITGGTSTSSTAIILDTTFQKYFDYTQAWSCTTANLGYAIPVTGAGLAGSPVLFAQGNVTISTTKVMNGSGSLNMGSYTLTAETAIALPYTYTGGSFSQATTQPAFSGGTLTIGAAATYTFTMESGKVVATPTSASNYVLSNGTFTGSNIFWNTTAYNITVEIPAGATFSSAGSPGAGTVTFVAPVEYQSVTVTGFTAGSRIYIKDVTSGTVLCNATASTTNVVISGSSCVWTDPSAASATRQIALRIAYVSGATAKVFIDNTNIGTCATSGGGKDVSYIASQSADTTYNSNAVDGSTVTGITFTDAATDLVVCNLAGGSTTWPRIYAAFVYWLSTSTGIDDDVTYISAPDTANYLLTAMKIRNANATPLTITSGYGRSATTGLVEDIIDVAGSTGNIYPEPNHVVPYQTTGTYAITGDISTVLTSIGTVPDAVLAAAAVDPIAADVKKVLGTSIQTGSTSTASIGY